jgi:hypothetical protein
MAIVTNESAAPTLTDTVGGETLGDDVTLVPLSRHDPSLHAALAAVRNACIYDRGKSVTETAGTRSGPSRRSS